MAHFAEIDNTNTVVRVIVVGNDDCAGGEFPASEPVGQAFIASIGLAGTWKQTSYSGSFRKRYAGIGYTYDQKKDQFVSPAPFPSWTLDKNNDWQPPKPKPEGDFVWDEAAGDWVEI